MTIDSITILICTYNRASLLSEALDAIERLDDPGCPVQVVVVDNNSTDATADVVRSHAAGARYPVLSICERRQGKSFALNAGLAAATGDVLALTDDDCLPARDWLQRIVDGFRRHDVTFVFGKVLPRWTTLPPPELLTPAAQEIWGPLAIVDYGDSETHYSPDQNGQRLPVGANLAFLRSALVRIGGWRTDLGKVDNSLISGEDHEIFLRLRRHDLYAGFYDPGLTVRHHMPPARLTRTYFRRWFYWHGRTLARMLDDLYPELSLANVPHVGRVPRFAYRQALGQCWRYLASRTGDPLTALIEELRLIQYAGLFDGCWRQRRP